MVHAEPYRTLENLTLTPRALSFLRELFQASDCRGPAGLRLTVRSRGWEGLSASVSAEPTAETRERTLSLPGLRLFLDSESSRLLEGALLDCSESQAGARLCLLDLALLTRAQRVVAAHSSEKPEP